MTPDKEAIVDALYAWINQRPGLEPGNYISGWNDAAGRAAYRSESRRITRQGHDARTLLRSIVLSDSITADMILAACRAYSGRLSIKVYRDGDPCPRNHEAGSRESKRCGVCNATGKVCGVKVRIDYCTGQYWPTEYRAAVCAVLSQCLWDWRRDHAMPEPVKVANGGETYAGLSAGDYIRRAFRREYGAAMQRRWFD